MWMNRLASFRSAPWYPSIWPPLQEFAVLQNRVWNVVQQTGTSSFCKPFQFAKTLPCRLIDSSPSESSREIFRPHRTFPVQSVRESRRSVQRDRTRDLIPSYWPFPNPIALAAFAYSRSVAKFSLIRVVRRLTWGLKAILSMVRSPSRGN